MPILDPYKSKPFSKKGWVCEACGAWVADGILHRCKPKDRTYDAHAPETQLEILTRRLQELEERVRILEETIQKGE